jgi:hypothetical protein
LLAFSHNGIKGQLQSSSGARGEHKVARLSQRGRNIEPIAIKPIAIKKYIIGFSLGPSPVGMEKQPSVAAIHHAESEANETRSAVAEVVRNPIPFADIVEIKQGDSNFTASGAHQATIERPQCKNETVSSSRR